MADCQRPSVKEMSTGTKSQASEERQALANLLENQGMGVVSFSVKGSAVFIFGAFWKALFATFAAATTSVPVMPLNHAVAML